MGTPSYMAPEQAGGKGQEVGPAADVYALGAILYELLTGRPPFKAATALETLQQVVADEPVPPAQLNARIPADLETICLKCLQKQPAQRYHRAAALADDLGRFLAGKPIQARPVGRTERLVKWVRREPMVAGLLALVAFTLLLGTSVATVFGIRANNNAIRAEKAEDDTLASFRASTDDAIEELIGSKQVLGPQEKNYLEKTLKRWQAFAMRTGDDQKSRRLRAEGYFRVAMLRHKLGQTEAALAGYHEALTIHQQLVDDFPGLPVYRDDLANTYHNLGVLLADQNKLEKAAEHFDKSLAIRQKLADEFRAVPKYPMNLALTHNSLGVVLADQNQWEKSARQYRRALVLQRKLADEFPDEPDYRKNLAQTHHNLGTLLKDNKQMVEAADQFNEALAIRQKLADEFPGVPDYRYDWAGTHINLGILLAEQNRGEKAGEQYHKALLIDQKLVDQFPAVPKYREDLANALNNLGNVLNNDNQGEKAAGYYHKSLLIRQKLADECPTVPVYRKGVAQNHNSLGILLANQNKLEKAAEEMERALVIRQKLAEEYPAVPAYRQELAISHNDLGIVLQIQNQGEKAAEHLHKALAIQQKLAEEFPAATAYQVELGGGCCNYGNLLRDSGKRADSLPWYEKAIYILNKVHQQDPRGVTLLRDSYVGRAEAHEQLKKEGEADKDWKCAIERSPKQEQPSIRILCARSRVRMGRVASAITEVADLTRAGNWSADQWYDFACIYALASAKAADKKQEYADQAMRMLHHAVQAGYRDAAHMAKDIDLDVLHGRDDFKKLLEAMGKAEVKPPAGAR